MTVSPATIERDAFYNQEQVKRLSGISIKAISNACRTAIYRDAANTGTGWKNANLRTQFLKILKRAGVEPWNRIFHSMRDTRQTELEREFPLHVVCS